VDAAAPEKAQLESVPQVFLQAELPDAQRRQASRSESREPPASLPLVEPQPQVSAAQQPERAAELATPLEARQLPSFV